MTRQDHREYELAELKEMYRKLADDQDDAHKAKIAAEQDSSLSRTEYRDIYYTWDAANRALEWVYKKIRDMQKGFCK